MVASVTDTTLSGMLFHEIRVRVESEYIPDTLSILIECHGMGGISTYAAD